jgi:hypothetical protein
MALKPEFFTLLKPIPPQIVNEGATYGPLNLNDFFAGPTPLTFIAQLSDGRSLPAGLICTTRGILNGIAGVGTQSSYTVKITARDDAGDTLDCEFPLTIKEKIAMDPAQLFGQLKTEIWEALGKNQPLPAIDELLSRPISPLEIYNLLLRFATLTVWDAYNLDFPGEKQLLDLPDCSPHYFIYDRGSCLLAAPKSLYSFERTRADALQTAKAIAKEAYKRGWGAVELVSFDRMMEVSAWLRLKGLGDETGKPVEVLRFSPTPEELRAYTLQVQSNPQNR